MQPIHLVAFLALAAVPSRWGAGMRELPGLTLRGAGCHVELFAPDGGRICSAVTAALPKCAPFTALQPNEDGGMTAQRYRLGSMCSEPRLSSTALGNGGFLVEREGVVFQAICDDASRCQRGALSKLILECCQRDETIRGTPVCKVSPQAGVCIDEMSD